MAEAVRLRLDPATPVKPAGPARVFPSHVNLIPLSETWSMRPAARPRTLRRFIDSLQPSQRRTLANHRMTITGRRLTESASLPPHAWGGSYGLSRDSTELV